MTPDPAHLRSIKTFPQLVAYLRDELDWPIATNDFDELTFEYSADELGLDHATAVKIKEIKQLRPLSSKQPWGIFFVNFEPKRLPVVALRRILSALVLRKRHSANQAQRASWKLHDLLFISSYGESEHREITFAHFSEDTATGELPTLRVLGWDDEDTKLHVDHVEQVLKEKLRWPNDVMDLDSWRAKWSSGFTSRHREVITTSRVLAERLADLARSIRKRANTVLKVESDKGPLRKLHDAFKETLVHDLSQDDFADMYAQTISYGLLTARVSRPQSLVAGNLSDMVPVTNPFLKELLETFLTVGGRKAKIDFDELGISEVVQLLRDVDMEAVLRDFGDRNPQEDPVIHFYELFLKEYDAKKRMQRGVFYTPRPVVSFIVRSVHEILRKTFGLPDGLADTTTWGEMTTRHTALKIPKGVTSEQPFVQILDPATGTGTFLVETIETIYTTMREKWRKQGHMEFEFQQLWNQYVPQHLLPRLHGFELMMAPYAIAHMKIGLKLYETGYRFGSNERARIYLTNTLEDPKDFSDRFDFEVPALAHEAKAANASKLNFGISVIVGNPPYSKLSANLTDDAVRFISPFRSVDGQQIKDRGALALELNLQDDYVKFYGFMLRVLQNAGTGIGCYISNFRYLDSPSLRGMRKTMLNNSSSIFVLNLGGHGADRNTLKQPDDNVFDIEQGVAIGLYARKEAQATKAVTYGRLFGTRDEKGAALSRLTISSADTENTVPVPPFYRFSSSETEANKEFDAWTSLDQILPFNSGCIITSRDNLAIDFDNSLLDKIRRFANSPRGDKHIQEEIGFSVKAKWDVEACKRSLRAEGVSKRTIKPVLYRPFDNRNIYYFLPLLDTPSRPVCDVVYGSDNLVLLTPKVKTTGVFNHVLIARCPAEKKACSHDRATQMFPLFKGRFFDTHAREVNLEPSFWGALKKAADIPDLSPTVALHYIYAILHSPSYRTRYGHALRDCFPSIPTTPGSTLFGHLAQIGADLVALHLIDEDYPSASWKTKLPSSSSPFARLAPKFHGKGPTEVAIGYPQFTEGRLFVNGTQWFDTVTAVWTFQIGGYQVCDKWLKDRRGRTLTDDDIEHYKKIVVAIHETIRLMAEIDKLIDGHGGWPRAFINPETESKSTSD